MPNKTGKQEQLIEKRASALAVLLLTQRSDLDVHEKDHDSGLDLVVRFKSPGRQGVRSFGVELCGSLPSMTKRNVDKLLSPHVRNIQHRHGPFTFPVCMFFFTMEGDEARYLWVAEPVTEGKRATLRRHEKADSQRLDRPALDHIVTMVDSWYDLFLQNLVASSVNGSGHGQ